MTKTEWNDATDPEPMFEHLSLFKLTMEMERMYRVFASLCVRRAWHLLGDPRAKQAVETSERYAEGKATLEQLDRLSMQPVMQPRIG